MSKAEERLAALREKLEKARNENLKAVEDEGKRQSVPNGDETIHISYGDSSQSEEESDARRRKGRRGGLDKRPITSDSGHGVGSADEADGEDDDDRLRSMKRRARNLGRTDACPIDASRAEPQTITYGVTGQDVDPRSVDKMVDELKQVDKKRAKFRRRRTFDENRTDITFINEGNRLFNRTLDKHFDKFDSVKKIKDSLERGTA